MVSRSTKNELPWTAVERLGDVTVYPRSSPQEARERAREADAVLTNKAVVDAAMLQQCPRLRYVGVTATGFNVVDVEACRARAIAVSNVPGYSTDAVAQLVFALLLEHQERLAIYEPRVKPNGWANTPDYCFFAQPRSELSGKTMAVLGFGAIGQRVGAIATALGMTVLPTALPGGRREHRVALGEALARADVVTLHCPLTQDTHELVNDAFLTAMKPGAVLINTSRGGLVDEAALVRALACGKLGGALLDVMQKEPPPTDHPLLIRDAPWSARVIVTPHIAWGAVESRQRLIAESAANLAAFQAGERRHRVD